MTFNEILESPCSKVEKGPEVSDVKGSEDGYGYKHTFINEFFECKDGFRFWKKCHIFYTFRLLK